GHTPRRTGPAQDRDEHGRRPGAGAAQARDPRVAGETRRRARHREIEAAEGQAQGQGRGEAMTQRFVIRSAGPDADTVAAVGELLGRPPDRSGDALAAWERVAVDPRAAEELAARHGVDAGLVPMSFRLENFRLIAFDMDSTLITIEC